MFPSIFKLIELKHFYCALRLFNPQKDAWEGKAKYFHIPNNENLILYKWFCMYWVKYIIFL